MIASFNTNENNQMEKEKVMSWGRKGRLMVTVTLSWEWDLVLTLKTQSQVGAWVIDPQ